MEKRMTLSPFLAMNGNAAEAIRFYEKHLKAQVVFLKTYEDMKAYDPEFSYESAHANYISHSVLLIGESQLMIADGPVNGLAAITSGDAVSLCFEAHDVQTVQEVYDSLTADARTKIILPFEKSIFSDGYAVIIDPFGVTVQLNVASE